MNTTWTPNKRPGLCGKINSGVDGVTTLSMYKTKFFYSLFRVMSSQHLKVPGSMVFKCAKRKPYQHRLCRLESCGKRKERNFILVFQ